MKKAILLFLAVLLFSEIFALSTYVVTKTTDVDPFLHPYKFNDADCDPDMYGTIQWAINKANDDNDYSRIEFNIPGIGQHEIFLNYYLPQITGPTEIDGRTQSGYTFGTPQIIINAQNKQNSVFNAYKTNVTIKGLKITSFAQNGILLQDCSNSLVAENVISNYSNSTTKTPFIGLFINGCQNVEVYGNEIEVLLNETVDQVTKSYGIYLSKSYQCTIGGTGTNMANTIKNCRTYGVFLNSTQQTKISGNAIFGCERAIYLNYSNDNIQPPVIASYTNGILSGTALPNSTVEVFGSTGEENANEYWISTVADGNGDWSVEVSTEMSYFVTTQTDNNNSSVLSAPYENSISNCITPEKPQNIVVYDVGKNTAKVTWQMTSNNVGEEFTYYWIVDTIPESNSEFGICNGETQETSITLTCLEPTVFYYFRIYAKTNCNDLISEYAESEAFSSKVKNSLLIVLNKNLTTEELFEFDSIKNIIEKYDEVFYFEKVYGELQGETLERYYHLGCGYNEIELQRDLQQSSLINGVIIEPKQFLSSCCDIDYCTNTTVPNGESQYIDNNYVYEALNMQCAWGITTGDESVRIAIIDRNFKATDDDYHIDFAEKIIGYTTYYKSYYYAPDEPDEPDPDDPDPVTCTTYHGAKVTGVAVAANNAIGLTGIGYNIKANLYLMPVIKITDDNIDDFAASMSNLHSQIAQAIEDENKVINISYKNICYSDHPDYLQIDDIHEGEDHEIFTELVANGVVIVTAAGNEPLIFPSYLDQDNKYQISDISGVIVVGGVDQYNRVPFNDDNANISDDDALLSFYKFAINEHVTICAPAKDIWTTDITCTLHDQVYSLNNGTSLSSPIVAATVALMLSANPNLTPAEIEDILVQTSKPIENSDIINNLIDQENDFNNPQYPAHYIKSFNAGSLDAYKAVLLAANTQTLISNQIEQGTNINLNSEMQVGSPLIIDGNLNLYDNLRMYSSNPVININNDGYFTINSNGNILANDLDFFYGEIVIENGGTMEINSGAVLNFYDAEIIVKRGGTLIIDGAVITNNCGDLWKGITVEGDFANPSGPGKLYIKNNASIEYAETAVSSSWNGLVRITGSSFINCPTGIDLYNYNESFLAWSAFPNLKPRAYVNTCDFVTNDNYVYEPLNHMNLRFIDKITLKGNTYSNISSNELLSGSARGNGINSINSGLRVIENRHFFGQPDSPMTPEDKSRFQGLYYGIYAQNTSPQHIIIRNCDFIEYEKIGAYIKASNLSTITSNTFTSNAFGEVAGLYLQNCGGYQVENNTFNDWVRGLVVNSSSTSSNEIYRNKFNFNTYSLSAYYNNANSSGYQGLFMQCNDFNQNNANFDTNIFVAKGDVKKEQGHLNADNPEYSVSAANQFETSMLSGAKALKTFNTNFNYKYYYNMPGDVTDISGFTSDNVETQAINTLFNDMETCESKLPGIKPIVGSEHIAIKKNLISSKADSLENLIDGSNTPATLQKVQNLHPNNFNKTCNELLQISPYLSDTVLCSFMQTSVNGHVVAKTNVLLANSPLPPNAAIELANMDLPQPHKALIYQHQTGTNAVVIKQQEIGQLEYEKDLLVDDFARYRIQNDSVPELKNEALEYLIKDDSPVSNSLAIQILISDGKYSEASHQLNLLESKTSNLNDKEREEYFDFVGLQRIIIKTDTTYNVDEYLEIIETNQTFIEEIAYNPDHKCSSQAQTLLTIAGLAVFEPEFIIPMENRVLRLYSEQENLSQNFDLSDLVEVYPTPASTEIWIEYLILENKPATKIEIFNIEGKLVLTQSIRNGFGVEQINITQLSEGNYILKLGEFTKQISVIK